MDIKIINIKRYIFIVIFILLVILSFLLFIRLGLDYDESVFLFYGDSILHGSILYKDCIDIKPPGIFYLLALIFFIFGKSVYAAKSVHFMVCGLSAVILFLIGKKLWNEDIGMLSSILFLFGTLMQAYTLYAIRTDIFMVLFGLLGFLLFFKSIEKDVYLIPSGMSIGLSTLFKQPGGLFLLTILLFSIFKLWRQRKTSLHLKNNIKRISLIFSGFFVPIIIVASYFWFVGALDNLIYWSLLYSLTEYGRSLAPVINLMYNFLSYSIVWVFSFVSLLIICYKFISRMAEDREIFIAIWFLLSLYPLTIKQDGDYFVLILPAACLLSSLALIEIYPILSLKSIRNSLSKIEYQKIFTVICIFLLIFITTSTVIYGEYKLQNERAPLYNEEREVADFIQSHTTENEMILSNSPSIYFLSGRMPPISYSSVKPFGDVIEQIKKNDIHTNYIVIYKDKISNEGEKIYEFIRSNYKIEKQIGKFDIYKRVEEF